jgi:hypothetical protein
MNQLANDAPKRDDDTAWNDLLANTGWNECSQRAILMRFVAKQGLMPAFVAYAATVAEDEIEAGLQMMET